MTEVLREAGTTGRTIIVEGEAGMGKTALIDACLAEAGGDGLVVLWASAQEMDQYRPFGILADCFGVGGTGAGTLASRVAGLLDRSPGPLPTDDPVAVEFALGEAMFDLIEERSARDKVVVVLEDLHWADRASLVLVDRLGRAAPTLAATVVCSARPASGRPELAALLRNLRAQPGTVSISLPGLTSGATGQLVANLVGGLPGGRLRREMDVAGGNPLFVIELVHALIADEAVSVDRDGQAEIEGSGPWPSLSVTILGRLGALAPANGELLRSAAVLGERFSVAELSQLVDRPAGALFEQLRAGLTAGILVEEGEHLAFRHDLIREALYEDIPEAVRRGLHRDAARSLAAAGVPAGRVAEHLLRGAAGDPEAAGWLHRAATEIADESPATALDLLDRALGSASRSTPARAELLADRALALVRSGNPVAGEAACQDVLRAGAPPGREGLLRLRRAQALLDMGRAREAATEARLASGCDSLLGWARARFEAWGAVLALFTGDLDGALAAARRVEDSAGPDGDIPARITCRTVQAHVANARSRHREAEGLARSAVVLASSDGAREAWATGAAQIHALTLCELDRLDEAEEVAHRSLRRDEELGLADGVIFSHQARGAALFHAGRWDDALVELETGWALADRLGRSAQVLVHCVRALIKLWCRGPAAAEAMVRQAELALASDEVVYRRPWVAWVRAACLEARDCGEDALAVLGAAWDGSIAAGTTFEHRLLGPDLVALAVASGDGERALQVAAEIEAVAAVNPGVASLAGAAGRARGLAAGDPDLLVSSFDAYRRSGRRPAQAQAGVDAAVALARASRPQEAAACAEEALALLAEMGAGWQAGRVRSSLRQAGLRLGSRGGRARPASGWGSLTPAEARVAELVAAHRSNPEIAAELFVSRATVQTHVSHILRKLGFESRRQLAAAQPDGLSAAVDYR